MLNLSLNWRRRGRRTICPTLPFRHVPPYERPCHTLETPSSPQPKPCPHRWPCGALRRGPHRRTDRRKRMRTSSGARASASGSRTRRFSFRRACEWSLARHRVRGGKGRRQRARGRSPRRGREARAGVWEGWGGAGPSAGRGPARHRVPTTGPCGMLYWRSTAANSASDRTA